MDAWKFYGGSYQPAQYWLKDRERRIINRKSQISPEFISLYRGCALKSNMTFLIY
jgi:hypothetical protein